MSGSRLWLLWISAVVAVPGLILSIRGVLEADWGKQAVVLIAMVLMFGSICLVVSLPRLHDWLVWRRIEREARENRGTR